MRKTRTELQAEIDELKAKLTLQEQVISRLLTNPASVIVPMSRPLLPFSTPQGICQ